MLTTQHRIIAEDSRVAFNWIGQKTTQDWPNNHTLSRLITQFTDRGCQKIPILKHIGSNKKALDWNLVNSISHAMIKIMGGITSSP